MTLVRSVSEARAVPNGEAAPFEAHSDLFDMVGPRPNKSLLGEQSWESAFGSGTSAPGVFEIRSFIPCIYSAWWRFPGVKQFSVLGFRKQLAVQFAFLFSPFFLEE